MRRKSDRFPGMNFGRGAALSRSDGCPDAGALQGAGRALTDCLLPVFGRASENQGLSWGSLAHRPCLRLGRGLASIGATEKRRGAVKGRVAAKRSDVYPLRRPLFCQTGRAEWWALWDKKRETGEEATKGAGPDQGLSWEAEHRPSEPLPGQSTIKTERGGTDERSEAARNWRPTESQVFTWLGSALPRSGKRPRGRYAGTSPTGRVIAGQLQQPTHPQGPAEIGRLGGLPAIIPAALFLIGKN